MLREALQETPVVLINEARQIGKSTLVGSGELGDHNGVWVAGAQDLRLKAEGFGTGRLLTAPFEDAVHYGF